MDTNIQSAEWVDIHGRTVNVQAVKMSDGQWKHFVFWHQEQADGSVIAETHPTALELPEPVASQLADVISSKGGAYEFRPTV